MTGIDYTKGEFINQINNSISSGDLNVEEWITTPSDLYVYYEINATSIKTWLQNNEIVLPNISIQTQMVQYDEYGTRIESKPKTINIDLNSFSQ